MKKDPRVLLGLAALSFSMKGVGVTAAEREALRAAAEGAAEAAQADGDYALLRRAALDCAEGDPLTEQHLGALRAALAAFQRQGTGKAAYARQDRKDMA